MTLSSLLPFSYYQYNQAPVFPVVWDKVTTKDYSVPGAKTKVGWYWPPTSTSVLPRVYPGVPNGYKMLKNEGVCQLNSAEDELSLDSIGLTLGRCMGSYILHESTYEKLRKHGMTLSTYRLEDDLCLILPFDPITLLPNLCQKHYLEEGILDLSNDRVRNELLQAMAKCCSDNSLDAFSMPGNYSVIFSSRITDFFKNNYPGFREHVLACAL
jgi:hypothetical protein